MATLGNTVQGASSDWWPTDSALYAGSYTMTEDGTGVSMSFFIDNSAAFDTKYRLAVFTNSAGSPGTQITNGITPEIVVTHPFSAAWVTTNFAVGPTLTNGTTYWLVMWFGVGSSSSLLRYTSTANFAKINSGGVSYASTGTMPAFSSGSASDEKASLYVTYTPSGGAVVTPPPIVVVDQAVQRASNW